MSASLENLEARIAQLAICSAAQLNLLQKIVARQNMTVGQFFDALNTCQDGNLAVFRAFAETIPDEGLRYKFIKHIEKSRSNLDQLQAMIEQLKRDLVPTDPAAGESSPLA